MKTVTVFQMQELDRRAIEEAGVPSIVLMENAGQGVSEIAREMLGGNVSGKRIAIFCGVGNNGGDGFVTARHLIGQGAEADVCIIGDRTRIKNDPSINLNILEKMEVKVNPSPFLSASGGRIKVDLIIDAIFGIGLKGEVKEPVKSVIGDLNRCGIPILSVDVPSGLDADTGKVLGEAIKATKTATMQFAKNGFYVNKGPEYVGEVVVVDIGIPEELCAG